MRHEVIVSDLELEAIEPRKTRTIDIEQFVDLADVDPIYFDHPYFLVPAGEVSDVKGIDAAHQKSHKPTRKQLDAAVAIIEALSCDWDPDRHKDRYRARLKRVVDRKRRGETIKTPKASEEPEAPADLMAALEHTLEELQSGNGRRR